MKRITPYFRLFLVLVLVLSPVQSLLAASVTMQSGCVMAMDSDMALNDGQVMAADNGGLDWNSGACQDSSQCNNCPASSGALVLTAKHYAQDAQTQIIVLELPLYSMDLSPDHRPPRYS